MALGAMAGHAMASMVPPSGFEPGMSPAESMHHGCGHSFGRAIGDLKSEVASLKGKVDDLMRYHDQHPHDKHGNGVNDAKINAKLGSIASKGRFMRREEFAQLLDDNGLLEKQPGAKHEGQHVFHIIAASNGGPDHTDNYLYALGGSFNIAVGDRFDHLNCFLAGKAKAQKAVAIAIKVANDPGLSDNHIDKRGKDKPVTFLQGRHKSIQSGQELYAKGEALFRDMRAAARG